MADTAAKEATGWRKVNSRNSRNREIDTNNTAPPPETKRILKAALRRKLGGQLKEKWEDEWHKETRGRRQEH
jgi:hypothetical protein